MARQFGSYSPSAELGITWEEQLSMLEPDETALDLTGFAIRAQLFEDIPERDPDTGLPVVDPLFEITTPSFYGTLPTWPVIEGFDTNGDPTKGIINLSVPGADTWKASPDNEKVKLVWSIVLVNTSTSYSIPVVSGKVSFLPARTVL